MKGIFIQRYRRMKDLKNKKGLFLYGKIADMRKAVMYCELHKCYLTKHQLFSKKFRCNGCRHRKEVNKWGDIYSENQ